MAQPRVTIIGAGIAGLVLGRSLLKRGIPAVLYDRDGPKPRYSYGISLYGSAYRQLLPVLDLDEDTFVKRVAVDGPVGGRGRDDNRSSFRALRMQFEELLREGLDIRWGHTLQGVQFSDGSWLSGRSLNLDFDHDKGQAKAQLVVGADGVHSKVRKIVSPDTEFNILPFAVYNGKTHLSTKKRYNQKIVRHLSNTTILNHRSSNTLLSIGINERTEEKLSLSFTYSRPAKGSDDALFRPERPMAGATDIPEQLFTEVNELQNLEGAFKEVFDADRMKNNTRLLNWLMRSVLVPDGDLEKGAEKGVVLLGDSAYHSPILGSKGANEAIEDALELAEYIASGTDLKEYYKSRYQKWTKSVQNGEARLAEMHGVAKTSL